MGSLGQVHVDCLAVALVNVDAVKDGKSRMWQERVSPRGEGEKMKALLTAKVGMFLVVSSVLAVWTLLAAQSVQAQTATQSAPSCPSSAFITNFDAETKNSTRPVLEGDTVAIGDDSEMVDALSDGWPLPLMETSPRKTKLTTFGFACRNWCGGVEHHGRWQRRP